MPEAVWIVTTVPKLCESIQSAVMRFEVDVKGRAHLLVCDHLIVFVPRRPAT